MKNYLKRAVPLAVFCSVLAGMSPTGNAAPGPVLQLKIEGVINPIIGKYVEDGIKEAEKREASALLIVLNTPGGLLDATRTSISAMLNSSIPVIVYVSPRGSRATSAGLFVTMAADVAAMAPETHIGAAHPVTLTGGSPGETEKEKPDQEEKTGGEKKSKPTRPSSVMEEKMVSDASAYIRTLAETHGRNAEWAERAVRESVSLTAKEALIQNVVEYMADSEEALLEKLEGKTIQKNGRSITLSFKGSRIVPYEMSWSRKFLHQIAHPNVAYILMTIGIYALIYELASPGIGVGGTVGVICLLLAFLSLQVLPINTVGLLLILLGIILLIADLFTPTNGILSAGGLIAFGVGSFLLIDVKGVPSVPRVSLSLILPTVVATGAFFLFAVRKTLAARRRRPSIGREGLVGRTGEVRERIDPQGLIFFDGELWTARSTEPIEPGEKVEVTGIDGNILIVKR